MDSNASTLEHLSRKECIRLVASVSIGRIAYSRQALPAVELVNFTLADGDIVIRTDASGKFAVAINEAIVAFEADSVDTVGETGWSVTAVGQCHAVTDEARLKRLRQAGLRPWAPGRRDHFISIDPVIVTGRRLRNRKDAGTSGAPSR